MAPQKSLTKKMRFTKLLGQRLAAWDFDPRAAEFQVRVAVLNGFTAFGILLTEVVGRRVCPGRGGSAIRPFAQRSLGKRMKCSA